MYKNLIISEGRKEVMVAFRSLPVSSIVMDSSCQLVDINHSAMDLLKVKKSSLTRDFNRIIADMTALPQIMGELLTGKDIYGQKTELKRTDGVQLQLTLNAVMLYGNPKIFLFQFF